MRKIILYIILIIILFSGFNQVRNIWQVNEKSLDGTYADVKEGIFSWWQSATTTGKELRENLNQKINIATEKYNQIKADIESISAEISEKKAQLEQTLGEIEQAKKALDELLDREAVDSGTEDTSPAEVTNTDESTE